MYIIYFLHVDSFFCKPVLVIGLDASICVELFWTYSIDEKQFKLEKAFVSMQYIDALNCTSQCSSCKFWYSAAKTPQNLNTNSISTSILCSIPNGQRDPWILLELPMLSFVSLFYRSVFFPLQLLICLSQSLSV
jgi:hypothetical protein